MRDQRRDDHEGNHQQRGAARHQPKDAGEAAEKLHARADRRQHRHQGGRQPSRRQPAANASSPINLSKPLWTKMPPMRMRPSRTMVSPQPGGMRSINGLCVEARLSGSGLDRGDAVLMSLFSSEPGDPEATRHCLPAAPLASAPSPPAMASTVALVAPASP